MAWNKTRTIGKETNAARRKREGRMGGCPSNRQREKRRISSRALDKFPAIGSFDADSPCHWIELAILHGQIEESRKKERKKEREREREKRARMKTTRRHPVSRGKGVRRVESYRVCRMFTASRSLNRSRESRPFLFVNWLRNCFPNYRRKKR